MSFDADNKDDKLFDHPPKVYEELQQLLKQQEQELGEYRQFFQTIAPLLDKLDQAPELVQAIVDGKIDKELAKAVMEGKVEVKDTEVVQKAHDEVKKEMGIDEIKKDDVLKKKINSEKFEALKIILKSNNTLVTARAGSGKTRMLLALIHVLIRHLGFAGKEILLLSFGRSVAENNRRDLLEDFDIADFQGTITIHSLAHKIVAEKNPSIRDKIIEDQRNNAKLVAIIEEIVKKEKNTTIFGNLSFKLKYWWYLREFQEESGSNVEYETLLGEDVKSEGEKLIADWLFEHGVGYTYEQSYIINGYTYKPDFTVTVEGQTSPTIIEFWGLDNEEYNKRAENKRQRYQEIGLNLIEITPGDIGGGTLDEKRESLNNFLEQYFSDANELGREEKADKIFHKRFKKIITNILKFIQYARVQLISPEDITGWLNDSVRKKSFSKKDLFFSELACHVYGKYMEHLVENDLYDFPGLVEKAVEIIKNPDEICTFLLGIDENTRIGLSEIRWMLIDEFQDMSPILHLLISTIQSCGNRDLKLVGVGDDWQAIFGFAGSDTKYMADFEKFFSGDARASLPTNLRSGKGIVDVGNTLMQDHGEGAKAEKTGGKVSKVTLGQVEGANRTEELREKYIAEIRKIIKNNPQKSVVILTRNNKFLGFTPLGFKRTIIHGQNFNNNIRISTIHKFKGDQADVVIIVGVTNWYHPTMHPDRTLNRVLGWDDEKIYLSELRLFYVAMTRAKEKLYFITEEGRESPFIKIFKWE